MFIPDLGSKFFHPGSMVEKIPDPGSASASKILSIFNPTNYFYALGYMIPDPDLDFLPIPDPGVKKAADPGSGSATLFLGESFYNLKDICEVRADYNTDIFNKIKEDPLK